MNQAQAPVDILSEATGLSRTQLEQLWAEAGANQRRLEACPGPHVFVGIGSMPFRRAICDLCAGEVESSVARWYELGIEHGRKG